MVKNSLPNKIAEAYIPDKVASLRQRANETDGLAERPVIINFLSVNEKKEPPPAKKMIKVTTQFVELSKDYVKQFGFQWAPLLGQDNSSISIGRNDDGSVTSNSSNTLSATISNLFPKLQTFKEAGYARVIQSGMVIVTDGEKDGASLEKSTTTNLAVGNGETQRAVEANIGFTLKVNAQVLDQERIEVGVNFNVTLNAGTSGAPVESRNVINTKLVIKSKESAAIGGVVQGENRTAYDKNPPFGGVRPDTQNGITPLFDLRKSKSFLSSKNQFVMFLTPEIVASAAEGTREIRKKFRKRSR
jgi:pilus assembly protein CpaC